MSSPLQQFIDSLAKEKGIDPEIVVAAIVDAVQTASKKRYKDETLRARYNPDTGEVELCAVKLIVAEVTNPATEISLDEAHELYGDEAEVDMEVEFPRRTEDLGRIAAQTPSR